MSYGYTHKALKAYVYVCKTGNLAMVNSMKLCISTATGVYTRPLVKSWTPNQNQKCFIHIITRQETE